MHPLIIYLHNAMFLYCLLYLCIHSLYLILMMFLQPVGLIHYFSKNLLVVNDTEILILVNVNDAKELHVTGISSVQFNCHSAVEQCPFYYI